METVYRPFLANNDNKVTNFEYPCLGQIPDEAAMQPHRIQLLQKVIIRTKVDRF